MKKLILPTILTLSTFATSLFSPLSANAAVKYPAAYGDENEVFYSLDEVLSGEADPQAIATYNGFTFIITAFQPGTSAEYIEYIYRATDPDTDEKDLIKEFYIGYFDMDKADEYRADVNGRPAYARFIQEDNIPDDMRIGYYYDTAVSGEKWLFNDNIQYLNVDHTGIFRGSDPQIYYSIYSDSGNIKIEDQFYFAQCIDPRFYHDGDTCKVLFSDQGRVTYAVYNYTTETYAGTTLYDPSAVTTGPATGGGTDGTGTDGTGTGNTGTDGTDSTTNPDGTNPNPDNTNSDGNGAGTGADGGDSNGSDGINSDGTSSGSDNGASIATNPIASDSTLAADATKQGTTASKATAIKAPDTGVAGSETACNGAEFPWWTIVAASAMGLFALWWSAPRIKRVKQN